MPDHFAIVSNVPGYLPDGEDRTVANGARAAAEAMRAEVDRLLDEAVEAGSMSADEASSDLASIDAAIGDGDLQWRLGRDGSYTWGLFPIDRVVTAQRISDSDLTDDEIEWLDDGTT